MSATATPGHAPAADRQQEFSVATGRRLKPGQRNPTEDERDERDEAIDDAARFRGAGFPISRQWILDEHNLSQWLRHNFEGRRGDTNAFRTMGDLSNGEFALLLWDLDCYNDLVRRGLPTGGFEGYFGAGREDWGWLGELVIEWRRRCREAADE